MLNQPCFPEIHPTWSVCIPYYTLLGVASYFCVEDFYILFIFILVHRFLACKILVWLWYQCDNGFME